MKTSGRSLSLTSYDDLFSTDASRADADREGIMDVPLSELYPFRDHPFKVKDDDKMQETAESIREYGVLVPALARPRAGGGYELISGHRRKRGCELAGLTTMPVIVRELDDDAAVIVMVDSNIQRESLLPSERAFAYKMKLEAIKHQGARSDLTSVQVGQKLNARDIVAESAGESAGQVQRYIRLTHLIPEILDMVDNKRIALNPAVELSYLTPAEQELLVVTMDSEQATPSLSQAQRLKRFSQSGKLTEESMLAIMSEEKKQDVDRVTFTRDTLKKFFPRDYTPRQMEETILKLLQGWSKKRQQGHER
ncbi:MAG: ParB/RepB/Spo0J family partition protein [Aristaeellaceae bacterium]